MHPLITRIFGYEDFSDRRSIETVKALQGPPEQIEPGAVIGELSFFDGGVRSAGVRAVTDCELFRLSLESFEELAARDPVLARMVLFDLGRILSLRLRHSSTVLGT